MIRNVRQAPAAVVITRPYAFTQNTETARDGIELSAAQIGTSGGDAIELADKQGGVLALSETALASLTDRQIAQTGECAEILPIRVPTFEHAGGSACCMIAGVHSTPRPTESH